MSGVKVIRYLLTQDPAVLNAVAQDRIMAGDLPINSVLPAISIKEVSGTPHLTVAMNDAQRLHTERVQVTVHAKGPEGSPGGDGYPGIKALLKLVLAACKN